MDKQQIISFIQRQLEEGRISKEELRQLSDSQSIQLQNNQTVGIEKEDHTKNLINIFYGIGALIVIIGIIILIAQNWNEIGFAGRIIVTLGVAFVSYIAGFLFMHHEQKVISPLAFVISAALLPIGSFVLCDELSIEFSLSTQIAVTTIITLMFANALMITRKNILILVTIGYASWLYILAFIKLHDMGFYDIEWIKWAIMFLGLSYLSISYGLGSGAKTEEDQKEKKSVQRVLYVFGSVAILGAGISVGGFFDLIFIAILFGMFYLSIFIKSKEVLGFSSLFLMAHIIKLTGEYFADVLSWPIALIGTGFMIMAIGYGTFYLNKHFISKTK